MARGSIRQRSSGTFQVRVYAGTVDGKARYLERTVKGTKAEAELELARLTIEAASGTMPVAGGTVGELLEEWYRLVGSTWSDTTRSTHRTILDTHLIPALGHLQLRRLTTERIDELYASLRRKGLSPATVRRVHSVLHAALEVARRRWKRIAVNPASDAHVGRSAPSQVSAPEIPLAKAMIAAEPHQEARAAMCVALGTGIRRGELCGLQWRDVDLERNVLHVRRRVVRCGDGSHRVVELTKGERPGRVVPLDTVTAGVLAEHRARMLERAELCGGKMSPKAHVFSHHSEGKEPWAPNYLTLRFVRLRERLGITGVRLHDLRHAYCSQLLAAGIDVTTVASVAGHSRPTTTLNVYSHVVAGADRRVADVIGALLGEPTQP